MSKYQEFAYVRFMDEGLLVQALKTVGFTPEIHHEAVQLRGYAGDRRPERANVVLPRHQLSPVSNDIGFRRADDGSCVPIISEYDQGRYPNLLKHLRVAYSEQVVEEVNRRLRGTVQREHDGQLVKLRVRY